MEFRTRDLKSFVLSPLQGKEIPFKVREIAKCQMTKIVLSIIPTASKDRELNNGST